MAPAGPSWSWVVAAAAAWRDEYFDVLVGDHLVEALLVPVPRVRERDLRPVGDTRAFETTNTSPSGGAAAGPSRVVVIDPVTENVPVTG